MWFVPRAEGPWEVVVSRAWDRHHLRYQEGEDGRVVMGFSVLGFALDGR